MMQADPSGELRAQLLDARAAQLARLSVAQQLDTGHEHVCFVLGYTTYALPAAQVREIVPLETLRPLPLLPPMIAGLVGVRGMILAVIDLRPLMGDAAAPPVAGTPLVIIDSDGMQCALLSDSVHSVRRISDELMPSIASGQQCPWVVGITADLTIVLDGAALLSDERLIVDQADI